MTLTRQMTFWVLTLVVGVLVLYVLRAVVLLFVALILIFVPIISGQLGAFIDNVPDYVVRIQQLAMEPNRAWLRKILGEGVGDAPIGDLVKQGLGWITTFVKSLWAGGQALLSIFSLVVVTPVVAFYLLYD